MINEITYTLAELIPLLCPDYGDEEAYRVSRKIQNQVNVGLIHPIKKQQTGRGVHRKYTRFEVYKAKVLLELEPFHVPNTVIQLVANLFDDANPDRKSPLTRQSARKKELKKKLSDLLSNETQNKLDIYLFIKQGETDKAEATLGEINDIDPSWPSALVLNLNEIIRSVK